jgi:iron complex transport system ATP-binding protein
MLEVRDLSVSYGSRPVLRGLSLRVAAGEVVGLVGPNGSGKTTLLRAVTRVLPWQAGDVLIGETSAAALSRQELARLVAVVPQGPRLPAGYTALDVVLMGRTPRLSFLQQEGPRDLAAARTALERVGAAALAARSVDELSGGERQAVVLARALAQEAPVLLLDEPTANLDIGHQVAVGRLVRRLAAESGLAVLAALHDLTLASLYGDRLALLHEGVLIAEGGPAAVLTPENLRRAYGVGARVLRDSGLPGVVVLPYEGEA